MYKKYGRFGFSIITGIEFTLAVFLFVVLAASSQRISFDILILSLNSIILIPPELVFA